MKNISELKLAAKCNDFWGQDVHFLIVEIRWNRKSITQQSVKEFKD